MVDLRSSSRLLSARRRRRYRLRGDGVRFEVRPRLQTSRPSQSAEISDFPAKRKFGPTALSGRRFLIVSAPFGRFGPVMASVLEARGANVNRMIFNAGDAMNWRRSGGIVFKDTAKAWTEGLIEFASAFTDIILFGEAGEYNRAVLAASDRLKARLGFGKRLFPSRLDHGRAKRRQWLERPAAVQGRLSRACATAA